MDLRLATVICAISTMRTSKSGYEVVSEAILRYSREVPSVITGRWIEERKTRTRTLEKKAKAQEIYDGTDEAVGQSMPT